MQLSSLNVKIFKDFPEIQVSFAKGNFGFELNGSEKVLGERKEFLKSLKLEQYELATLSQVHGAEVINADNLKVDFLQPETAEADGLFSKKAQLFLGVKTADCLPVLFYHPRKKIFGIIHVGWRGAESQILFKAIQELVQSYAAATQDFYFYFGPAAQSCCYEGQHRNFVQDNISQLKALGIRNDQIENSGICTIHDTRFPSHRREKEQRKEVLLSIIGIRG
ncbi:MAG: hypothetical protein COT92_03455 [Candidatus Doudnabacteria bacterium CG10_big_fil_rev_8_21_14_0_10_42_18]|uniref:Purine nucleoside phosphorylase n=1 Tax=Candidatus Doudnabacteria bacterium CG10_big_fil_rev_8_21_14_0_10_42_18 TaxID=1974552 RepID=A0A2H0VA84_9BACT|nr:MAG: hypothetical protein COT92_03455 [Candidatus Doudnabacteria bacterium CG10_big_fil_rev_8_21_14_0_10_42_18]